MVFKRRRFLAAIGAIVVAGCTSDETDDPRISIRNDTENQTELNLEVIDTGSDEVVLDETISVGPGAQLWRDVGNPGEYRVSAQSGGLEESGSYSLSGSRKIAIVISENDIQIVESVA